MTRKSSAPPPRSPSPTSDEDSFSEEELEVTQPTPSLAKTSKRTRTERDGEKSDSDSDSESESDPEPPKANLKAPLKPSKPESSSDEDEEDEEEEEELERTEKKPKSPVKESESKPKPDKEKLKASAPDQTPSNKSSSTIPRIWSSQDEIALLEALSKYYTSNGELPQEKDYASFLTTISGSIGFPVTEKQIGNKITKMKYNYGQKIKKGSYVNISKPHDKAVFEMCAELFGGDSKGAKKKVKLETNGDVKMANGLGGAANGGVADIGDGMARPHSYLRGLIEDLIKEPCLGWLSTVETVIAHIGESRAADLEAKIKMLKVDEMKLRAREDGLKADLLVTVADEMADD